MTYDQIVAGQTGNPSATSPKSTYINNLSSKYGQANLNGNQTIYDKATNTPFSNKEDFFKASGTNSFDGLQFDTNYKPPTALDTARKSYLDSFSDTGVSNAKKAYSDFINSEQSGLNRIADKTIPMTFITGQQASLRRNSEATASRLQNDIGLATDQAGINQKKAEAQLGFAQDDANGAGANKLAGGLPFYKYPGSDQVFDAKTNQPLSFDQYKAAGGIGTPGQGAFGDVNEVAAGGTGTDKLLSVSEAKSLGVPYGTTQQQAAALSITPAYKGNTSSNNSDTGYPKPSTSAIKAIIAAHPGEWGHAADAIDAKYGPGTATLYDDLLKAAYANQTNTQITNPFAK